jgi:3-phenylpropionate/trans-cinnamate dioxygenase ferredoxin subunit
MAKHLVCYVADVYEGEMRAFEVGGRRVLVANANGAWHAVSDTCSHAEASLAVGTLDADECTVACPLHGAVFDLKTGEGLEFPGTEPIEMYPVTVEEDEVYVDFD